MGTTYGAIASQTTQPQLEKEPNCQSVTIVVIIVICRSPKMVNTGSILTLQYADGVLSEERL